MKLTSNLRYKNIVTHSKDVKKGDLFIALKGSSYNGHDFVEEALRKGAACAITEKKMQADKRIICVKDARKYLSNVAAEFYGFPSKKLKIIGVTGTNGKTTVSFLTEKILSDAGFKTGIVGTICYKIGRKKIHADMTTPDALKLNKILRMMIGAGSEYAILEISSHALDQKRASEVLLDIAVFTNLTPEHLDYHGDLDSYFEAKAKIFNNLKTYGVAVVNIDDPRSEKLKRRIKKKTFFYGLNAKADIRAVNISQDIKGSTFRVLTPSGAVTIKTKLIGLYNVYNILAALTCAYVSNVKISCIRDSIYCFKNVPGRLEAVRMGQGFDVFIDYAHTDDALSNVISTLRQRSKRRLITVFGCGGDRDCAKRPQMGKTSGRGSDYTIITSDNPRTENPYKIAKDIEKGIKQVSSNYSVVLDRKKALIQALNMADKGDVVLVAGKGHEEVQIVGNRRIRFSDRCVVRTILQEIKKK